jgi:hypothetical protein
LRKLGDAAISLSRGEITLKEYAKIYAIYGVLNPWLYNMATSLSPINAFIGDEDDRERGVLMDLYAALLVGNMNAIPIAGDTLSDVGNYAITGSKYPADTVAFEKELQKAGYSAVDLTKALLDEDIDPADIKWDKFFESLIPLGEMKTGLPLTTTKNSVEGLMQVIEGEDTQQGILRALGYSEKVTSKFRD